MFPIEQSNTVELLINIKTWYSFSAKVFLFSFHSIFCFLSGHSLFHMFTGADESQTARNNVVVLGGASKLKPKKGQIGNDTSNKKPRPHYNHCMIYMFSYFCVVDDEFEILNITIYMFFFMSRCKWPWLVGLRHGRCW